MLLALVSALAVFAATGIAGPSSALAIDDPAISIADASVSEVSGGTSTLSFTVTLSAASIQQVSAQFVTSDGTAAAPADYEAAFGTVTFEPGDTSKTVSVMVQGDELDELDETLGVELSGAVSATIADSTAVGTIVDDDPEPSLSIGDLSVVEGDSGSANVTLTVALSVASGRAVKVDHATLDGTAAAGTDFMAGSGTLTFAPGETSKTVSVEVLGDAVDEVDEALTVELSSAAGAGIGDPEGTIVIDDDDGPAISIADATLTEGTGGTSTLSLTVTLSAASPQEVSVRFATADGNAASPFDYAQASGTVTFAPGETSKTVSVTVQGDALDEPDETLVVSLADAVDGSIGDGSATGTITDDDPAALFPPAPAPASPGPAPLTAPALQPDRVGPRLTKVRLSPGVARPGSVLALGFKLDEAARVAGEVTLRTRGVRTKGGRCLKRTRARRGPGCTRRTRAGTLLAARAAVGENSGRLDLGQLRAGDYTLKLTPTDVAGNVGAVKLITFRVRR